MGDGTAQDFVSVRVNSPREFIIPVAGFPESIDFVALMNCQYETNLWANGKLSSFGPADPDWPIYVEY